MKVKKQTLGRGYAAAACREIGVSRTVFETAKKKRKEGSPLTKNELDVLVRYNEMVENAQKELESLKS